MLYGMADMLDTNDFFQAQPGQPGILHEPGEKHHTDNTGDENIQNHMKDLLDALNKDDMTNRYQSRSYYDSVPPFDQEPNFL
jgi:hypothetical protein